MKRKDKDAEALWAEVKRLTLETGRLQQQYDEQTACVIVHRGLMLACSDAMRAAYYDERHRAERLREEVERVTCELMDAITRADKLAEALRRYGVHDETCTAMDIPICTCGLDAALEQEDE